MNDSLENDSLEDEPLTRGAAIKLGIGNGATHVLCCLDIDGSVEYVLVMPGECIGKIEKACWRSSFSVETIDLDEMRKDEALE